MNVPQSVKNWWGNLLDRERQMIMVCSVVVGILFIYSALWSPLSDAVMDKKTEITNQQQLLRYLNLASSKITLLKSEGIEIGAGDNANLLSFTEQTLTQLQLSTYLKQVQQPKQNEVSLTFKNR